MNSLAGCKTWLAIPDMSLLTSNWPYIFAKPLAALAELP